MAISKKLIAVASPSFSKNDFLRKELRKHFSNCSFNEEGTRFDELGLIKFFNGASGAIVGLEKVNVALLQGCPDLKIISRYGVGLDNIDIKACQERGLTLGWTPGVNQRSVAELALGFMLALCKNIYPTSLKLKTGVWHKQGGTDLTGKTIGIIGVGHIGKNLIGLLKNFNCAILVNDIVDQSKYYLRNGCRFATKSEIFKKADIVTVHTPLTDKTIGLVGPKELRSMKKNSFLINTARGKIVDLKALKTALVEGWISGAGLDVYDEEPFSDLELLALPNLVCTPHIAGNSLEAVRAMGLSSIEHLIKYYKGQRS